MKNLLITGATGNLGQAILAEFETDNDYHINITTRDKTDSSGRIKSFNVDLLNDASAAALVAELVETQEHIDAVIFLTGAYISGDITKTTSADLQKMTGVNVATAHNIAAPFMQINREQKRPLKLIFIGAKAAMNAASSIENVAYALSKKMLFNYAELVNESENKYGTLAHIILPGALNTRFNREAMPDADFSKWTKPEDISLCIKKILTTDDVEKVISL
ncbi:MAG: SDR family NAD(P)-dependent oxidoreductase [Ferruginibacter sp.]